MMDSMKKIDTLEELARRFVGDGKTPDVFFVTDRGIVATVSTDFPTAYFAWESVKNSYPPRECALENRTWGVVCSVEPAEDGSSTLVVTDEGHRFWQPAV